MNILRLMIPLVLSLTLSHDVMAKTLVGKGATTGAIIGGGTGVGFGLIVWGVGSVAGSLFCSDSADANCNNKSSVPGPTIPLIYGGILGAAGAGIGALIGLAFHEDDIQVAPMVDPQTGAQGLMIHGSF